MKVLLLRLGSRLALAATFGLCLAGAQRASAAFVTPITPNSVNLEASGNQNKVPAINLVIEPYLTGVTQVYKANAKGGGEEGKAASFYSTVFSNTTSEPSDAIISWDGTSYISGATELLVKDGKHQPAWYLFDITGWNGRDNIVLTGFWPQGGAISFVAIYGSSVTAVPEPASLTMVALGVACLAGRAYKGRRRAAKPLAA